MYRHHSLEEKKEMILLRESGASMSELMARFHVRDHYLYILFGRYEKYGMEGLSKFKARRITAALKQSIIDEYEKDILPLWRICVEYDISFSSVCRWVRQYKQGGYEELFRHGPRGRPKKKDMGRPMKKEPQTEPERLQARVRWLEAENALLNLNGRRGVRAARYQAQAIQALRTQYGLNLLLEINGMARSTFFYHLKALERADKYTVEKKRICEIFHDSKGRYGYRRVTMQLHNEGFPINHKTVERLMRNLGLKCQIRQKRYRSYKGTAGKIAPNILNRDFKADRPCQKLVTDVRRLP